MKRIQFIDNEILKEFFTEIKLNNSNLGWNKIAEVIGTTRSMLINYRKGKLLLPEDRFLKLMILLNKDKQEYFSKRIIKKDENWGQIIGGINAYKINKNAFDKGRAVGAIFRKNFGVKYNFDINMPLSEELCEFLGVIIGDGCTNKYGRMYQSQIAGDKILDKEYYSEIILPLCIKVFGIKPQIVIRPSGLYMNIYSKRMFEMLTQRFRIPRGIKCYTVEIPKEILDSPKEMLNSVLRGMFNTDGGVGFDKRDTYKKPYVRINYTSASSKLINQIDQILDNYHIAHSVHSHNQGRAQQIQINGEKNVKIFLKEIGFSNPRHTKKLVHLTI